MLRASLATVILITLAGNVSGATIRVPNDHASIQGAIDAASEGDTVLVAPGTYTGDGNKRLDFAGTDLTLRSEGGAKTTIIDCEGKLQGFNFDSGETPAAVVDGFTVRNGNPHYGSGGGIDCSEASPTIVNCTFTESKDSLYGGGIYCFRADPIIANCTVSNNTANFRGGGIYCRFSSPTITRCVITGNSADNYDGGGIYCEDSSPTITHCTITDNSTQYNGGGVCAHSSNATIENSLVARNVAISFGAGGGIFLGGTSSPAVSNCTITNNSNGEYSGGGLSCTYGANAILTNSILWGNHPDEIHVHLSSPSLTFCDIEGGYGGVGNINADPRFRSYRAYDSVLQPGSPCIDRGTGANDSVDWSRLNRRYGRHNGAAPDMGAYGGPGAEEWLD